jgi:hypothetical protein
MPLLLASVSQKALTLNKHRKRARTSNKARPPGLALFLLVTKLLCAGPGLVAEAEAR